MKLYENYIDNIKNILAKDKAINEEKGYLKKSQRDFLNANGGRKNQVVLFSKPLNSLSPLMDLVGSTDVGEQKLGEHPDFKYLKNTDDSEYHYITSVFIDILKSESLFLNIRI